LANRDQRALREQLDQMSPDQIASAVQDLHPSLRTRVLDLVVPIDEVVPLLPEAELAVTVRSTGMADAGWLVEFATPEQRVACVDLDCWEDFRFSPSRLFEWIDAMIEAGAETLVAAFDELDLELWILAMQEMGEYAVIGLGDRAPAEYDTQDGMVFFLPTSEQNETRLRAILSTALIDSPAHYWRFVYGALMGSQQETEEWAERWHAGRMNDLGFPAREHAMRAYRPLAPEDAPLHDVGRKPSAEDGLVAAPQLPQRLAGTLVGRALAELPPDRAGEVLGYVLAVANALAVADELPLTEPDTIETSLTKAVRGIDRGLLERSKALGESLGRVLDRTRPLDLFRIGATLDPSLRARKTLADLEEAEEGGDWNIDYEEIDGEDRTLGPQGRPR
jgi:hypothetical protein